MLKFAATLTVEGQTDTARSKVISLMSDYGIEHTGGGIATLSFIASIEAFADLFEANETLRRALQKSPESGVGAEMPDIDETISIPENLRSYVDCISITPTAKSYF